MVWLFRSMFRNCLAIREDTPRRSRPFGRGADLEVGVPAAPLDFTSVTRFRLAPLGGADRCSASESI